MYAAITGVEHHEALAVHHRDHWGVLRGIGGDEAGGDPGELPVSERQQAAVAKQGDCAHSQQVSHQPRVEVRAGRERHVETAEEEKDRQRAGNRGHVLLYYKGYETAPLEQYVALAAIAGTLIDQGATAVLNESARTAGQRLVFVPEIT